MKYCTKCGSELIDDAVVCIKCGCACTNQNHPPDIPDPIFNCIAFLLPLVGFIMFLCMQNQTPLKAKIVLKFAISGFIVWLFFVGPPLLFTLSQ